MKKEIHPKTHQVTFKCATCGSEFVIESTNKKDTMNIDVCSNCHPFYKGSSDNQKARGRAEKLSDKFNAGKDYVPAKKETTTVKKESKNISTSFEDIK
jgi:large subunit ribosomal protein L31